MPEHEHDPEQELGPKIASAFQSQADAQTGLQNGGLAREARRRVRKITPHFREMDSVAQELSRGVSRTLFVRFARRRTRQRA